MRFTPDKLLAALRLLPPARRYLVAYSGGLDSHLLLHSLATVRDRLPAGELGAVHINHGLSPAADSWAEQCAAVCRDLDISCRIVKVDARPGRGESPEAAARRARYRAIAALLENGDGLLTAHHQDDQAETVLLQLLRGAGPRGLAAMPRWDRFAAGWRGRPLLEFSRSDLAEYARSERLHWVEDASNYDTRIERNFLRHEVIPLLRSHWPALAATLSRVAAHSAEASALLDQLAAQDLAAEPHGELEIDRLKALDAGRQRNLLRYWIRQSGLPLPDSVHLQRIVEEILPASADATPLVSWSGAEIRRYRNRLYLMAPLPPHDSSRIHDWDMAATLLLPDGSILRAVPVTGRGIRQDLCRNSGVTVRFRQGGERCRPAGDPHTRKLKKLLQEAAVPPWQRPRLPLIYLDDELAAVAGLLVCEPFRARNSDPGLEISWGRASKLEGNCSPPAK